MQLRPWLPLPSFQIPLDLKMKGFKFGFEDNVNELATRYSAEWLSIKLLICGFISPG